jgi:hypothetical protein
MALQEHIHNTFFRIFFISVLFFHGFLKGKVHLMSVIRLTIVRLSPQATLFLRYIKGRI